MCNGFEEVAGGIFPDSANGDWLTVVGLFTLGTFVLNLQAIKMKEDRVHASVIACIPGSSIVQSRSLQCDLGKPRFGSENLLLIVVLLFGLNDGRQLNVGRLPGDHLVIRYLPMLHSLNR